MGRRVPVRRRPCGARRLPAGHRARRFAASVRLLPDPRPRGRSRGGCVGFKGQPVEGAVEIGYGLVESARGHGYAAEAVEQLVEIARRAGVTTIRADTELDNIASSVTLQRAGFHQVGADSELLHYETNIVR
ncbi:MAG: GNAT family N-acetyltransferase [Mycobacteriaceae bacterium]